MLSQLLRGRASRRGPLACVLLISTGVFGFPCEEAARIAVPTVRELQEADAAAGTEPLDVVFNVFLDRNREIYRTLL